MIISTSAGVSKLQQAVPIERYFQIVGIPECAGMGVRNTDAPEWACDTIWRLDMRREIERYLFAAQEEIESHLGFHLIPRYTENEQHSVYSTIVTQWGYVIAAGTEAFEDIALAETVDLTSDPAVIGPVITDVTDEDEIVVYQSGTDRVLIPSAITIAGGTVTIEIPRCRLVVDENNPAEGWDYSDDTLFINEVDIRRRYTDTTSQVRLVRLRCDGYSSDLITDGYVVIRNGRLGIINIADTLTGTCLCNDYSTLYINYLSGLDKPSSQLEDAVVRLAHSRMPEEVCSCAPAHNLWLRDQKQPDVVDRQRLNCPFGLSDGAWIAWQIVQNLQLIRGMTL